MYFDSGVLHNTTIWYGHMVWNYRQHQKDKHTLHICQNKNIHNFNYPPQRSENHYCSKNSNQSKHGPNKKAFKVASQQDNMDDRRLSCEFLPKRRMRSKSYVIKFNNALALKVRRTKSLPLRCYSSELDQ